MSKDTMSMRLHIPEPEADDADVIFFGKYKGKTVDEADPKWIAWALANVGWTDERYVALRARMEARLLAMYRKDGPGCIPGVRLVFEEPVPDPKPFMRLVSAE